MNTTLSTILLVALILVLTGGAFYAGTVYARSTNFGMWSMMGGYGRGGMTLAPGAHLSWRTVPGSAGEITKAYPKEVIQLFCLTNL